MNVDTDDDDPLILFYDSDYPKLGHEARIKDNDKFASYGIFDDIAFYRDIAKKTDGSIIDLCCGSGRISVPLAKDGKTVTGVDISQALLQRLENDKDKQKQDVQNRLSSVRQNVAALDVEKDAALVIMAFNSFNCLIDMGTQYQTLLRIREHLKPGGHVVFDMANPFMHCIEGLPTPELAFERTELETGKKYARFVCSSPMQTDQTQTVHGWYDRTEDDGTLKRFPYSVRWRLVFHGEIALMLAMSGLNLLQIEGGFKGEPYMRDSMRMVIRAQKPE